MGELIEGPWPARPVGEINERVEAFFALELVNGEWYWRYCNVEIADLVIELKMVVNQLVKDYGG